ncbi:TonB-dependent receptor [Terricaulis sp.]|uniref:TonB-dependent receptor n=1 Tax=Terricaulis sp. TaxID=2768686 RepID=UPI003784A860
MAKQEKQKRQGLWRLLFATTALAGVGAPTAALAQDDESAVGEIVVTATKRAENLQDVPISVQALGEERLVELGITDFEEYAQHLPTLAFSPSYGPGYNRPFMRGVASGENGNHSGSMPSVGTYLDEQPITTIVGNLDMHLYDIARVEVLAGPQGTLYGASSQAGTVRIITNRPDPTEFSAAYNFEFNATRFGGYGQIAEGYINIPLSDRAAVRIVGWADHDDGYIDNVSGSRFYETCDFDVGCLGTGPTDENSDVSEQNYNSTDTWGGRIALGIDLNESWTVTPQLMGQQQSTEGVFAQQSGVRELGVMHFFPEWNEDNWIQGALTVEGRISDFDIVFSASRLGRDVDSNQDYADYGYFYDVFAGYGCYYVDNAGAGSVCDVATGGARLGNPINPGQQVEGRDHYDRQTYEFRVASPANNRVRAIAGIFYQLSEHQIHQRYYFSENFRDAYEVTGWPDTIWLTEQTRTDEETALFGELSFDFTDRLTGTVGMRSYRTENSLVGFFGFGPGFSSTTGESQCFGGPFRGAPCTNLDASTSEEGELYRANLQWRIDDDRMIYATYSEGFRPGGINRRGSFGPYGADFLDNFEVGWKTDWADGRLRWNGAVFHEVWNDFQYAFISTGSSGLTQIQNAGDAEIDGVETELTWVPFDGMRINAGATWLTTELTSARITGTEVGNELPVSPDLKFDFTARYEFVLGNWEAFVQGGATYVGERQTSILTLGPDNDADLLGTLPEYWIADISTGVERDGLSITLFVDNLFDERAINGRYTECAVGTCGAPPLGDALEGAYYDVVARPMTAGIRIGRRY